MIVGFMIGTILYGAITLLVLILSTSAFLDDVQNMPARLIKTFFVSVFWPVSLLVLTSRRLASHFTVALHMLRTQSDARTRRPLRATRTAT